MDQLNACLEVAGLLMDCSKVVEDDTCLERILTGLQEILNASYSGNEAKHSCDKFLDTLETFQMFWEKILMNRNDYCSSTINFLLKLNAIVLQAGCKGSQAEENSLSFLVRFPAVFSQNKSTLSPSIASSWISSICLLICSPELWKPIAKYIDIHCVAELSNLRSIFVHKQACNFLAEFGISIERNSMRKDVRSHFTKFGQAMKTLPIETSLEVATKMLNLNYGESITAFSAFSLGMLFESQMLNCVRLCRDGDVRICHFYEEFYVGEMASHMSNTIDGILRSDLAFHYSFTALLHNPTRPVGWKMLSAFAINSQASTDTNHAMELIVMPLQLSKSAALSGSYESSLEWLKILQSLQKNRTKMTAVVCHCLNSLSKFWKSSRYAKIVNDSVLPSLLEGFKLLYCNDYSVDMSAIYTENWKIAEAVLNVFMENYDSIPISSTPTLKIYLLEMIGNRSATHSVIQLSHRLALKIILADSDSMFIENTLKIAILNLLDRRWEVRDSTLGFLSQLIVRANNSQDMDALVETYSVHAEAMRMLKDSDSFVRAGALILVCDIVKKSEVFDSEAKVSVVQSCIGFLFTDSEAAPRRAAALTLLECLKVMPMVSDAILAEMKDSSSNNPSNFGQEGNPLPSKVLKAMNHALFEDLDWEVKFNSLDIVEYLVHCARGIQKSGGEEWVDDVEARLMLKLREMLDDCDAAVAEKSRMMLSSLVTDTVDHECQPQSEKSTLLIELDNLLEEALALLRKNEQVRLTHGCHGPAVPAIEHQDYDDSVVLDCY